MKNHAYPDKAIKEVKANVLKLLQDHYVLATAEGQVEEGDVEV